MQRYQIVITGKVQGVGFRKFLQEKAHDLGLTGFVKNLPNGNVLTEVQGNPAALSAFLRYCAEGPPRSFIASLHIEEITTDDRSHNFTILV